MAPDTRSALRADPSRLQARHDALAAIGAIPGGGSCRLCMTPEDGQARDLFASWCEQAGLRVSIDRAGNMFGVREGSDSSLPVIVSGSHLDTQPHGGRFDGISGVLCALEALETMNDRGIGTRASVAVVNWTNEEGVRFAPGLTGSSWFVGDLTDEQVHEARADDGARFADDARRLGYLGELGPAGLSLGAYYELHIEQGPILEQEGLQIGVVESVQGLRWLDVDVVGTDAHAGTTPMDQRQDAILASAGIITALAELGQRHGPDARVSVGRLKPDTDGASTIAGRTAFVIDVRHPDETVLDALVNQCWRICHDRAAAAHCQASVSERLRIAPTGFDVACVDRVELAAREFGYRARRMTSGALHDASNIARIAPSAMIFVPCKDGISHNVAESAKIEDLEAGCNVLLHVLMETAGAVHDSGTNEVRRVPR